MRIKRGGGLRMADVPLVDLGNYPVIFASTVARIDKLSHDMVSIIMAEERRNEFGNVELVVVCRLIRPARSVSATATTIAKAIGEAGVERVLFANSDSPAGMQ